MSFPRFVAWGQGGNQQNVIAAFVMAKKLGRLCAPLTLRALALARIGGAHLGALLAAFLAALRAPAAFRLDVGVPVILAVVVGDFVPRLDAPDRLDPDASLADHRIGVRAA
jgi:hypothetical protein